MTNHVLTRYLVAVCVILSMHFCMAACYFQYKSLVSSPLFNEQTVGKQSSHMQVSLIRKRSKKQDISERPIEEVRLDKRKSAEKISVQPKQTPVKKKEVVDEISVDSEDKIDQEALQALVEIKEDYLSRVIAKIERHKEYPRLARKRQREGDVIVGFIIQKTGDISFVELLKSSQYKELDNAAIKAVKESSPFEAIPTHLREDEFRINLTISFTLF